MLKYIGVRYEHGKVLLYRYRPLENPGWGDSSKPDWAVDIREILAMLIVGLAAICLIFRGHVQEAMYLLLPLAGYAIGRTVPYPSKITPSKKPRGKKKE